MCRADYSASDAEKNATGKVNKGQEVEVLGEAFVEIGVTAREAAEAIDKCVKSIAMSFLRWLAIDPKWEHLAAHAKKLRTRKKYQRKIAREEAKLAAGIECGAVSVSEDGFNVASRV